MVRVPVGASRGLRWGCLTLAAMVALLALTTDPADARRRKRPHFKRTHATESYSPPYAAIVVDARNGAVLHQSAADSPRHPASLTKIMTLYLLFERLDSGRITLDTPMEVSEFAASQAPTKLGLKPGSTIRVEDAIKGLVTKSANDAAVVVAETLGGGEEEFARAMTRKAHALGMRHTVYRNASGLPDDEQVTTARDQALLGIAIQERFPKHYRYFSLASFVYRGRAMANHNRLLGRVEGVDGIKTGYTRSSGFNLVTSVKRGAKRIIAVVLGGRSGRARDARMRDLIDSHIAGASTRDTVVAVAEKAEPKTAEVAPRLELATKIESAAKAVLAAAGSTPTLPPPPTVSEATATITAPGSSAPITPVKVKTVTVKLVPPKHAVATAAAKPVSPAPAKPEPAKLEPAKQDEAAAPAVAFASAGPSVLGALPAMVVAAKEAAVPAAKAEEALIPTAASARHSIRHGWIVQVGAYESEAEAKEKLSSAQSKAAALLQKTEAYTERTTRGEKTYFRARFAGFDRDRAEAVCKRLKREDIICMALKI